MKIRHYVYATALSLALIPATSFGHLLNPLEKIAPLSLEAQKSHESDILTLVLAAEMAIQRNLLQQALEKYVLASQLSLDSNIVKRATELAVELQEIASAKIVSKIWADNATDDMQAQMVVLTLFIDASKTKILPYLTRLLNSQQANLDEYFISVLLKLSPENKQHLTEILHEFALHTPENLNAKLIAAQACAITGKIAHAKKWVGEILQQDPKHTTGIQLQAKIIRHETNSDDKALTFLSEKLKESPSNSKLRVFYINALLDNTHDEKAIAELAQLSQDKAYTGEALLSLSQLYLKAKKTKLSEKMLYQVLLTEKDEATKNTAHFFLGKLYEKQKHNTKAIESYLAVEPGMHHISAQLRAAEILSVLQFNHTQALEVLQNATPENLMDQKRLALSGITILQRDNQLEAAMKAVNYYLSELPGDLDLLYARALIASRLQQVTIVEQDLQIVLTLNPNHANALNVLGFTLANQTNRFEEARAYLDRAIALNGQHPAYLESLGWLEYRQGNLAQALSYLEKAASLSDNPSIATHLGEVLWAMKKSHQAQQVWQKVLNQYPNNIVLLETLKRLKVKIKPKTISNQSDKE